MSTQSPRLGFVCPCLAAAGLGGVLHLPFLRRAEKYIAYLWQAPCEVFIAAVSPQAPSGIWNRVWGKKTKTFPGMTPPGPLAIISGQPFCSDQEFSHVPRSNFQMTFKHRT